MFLLKATILIHNTIRAAANRITEGSNYEKYYQIKQLFYAKLIKNYERLNL